jgi:DNA polymerase-3 subunit delta'
MPFRSDEIVRCFSESRKSGRLGHAYLLTGGTPPALEALARQLATDVLEAPAQDHPDFYYVRPESKSRRITVEQMRDLEKSLYLMPFKAPCKVALIASAERMCAGQAEAANAFLKTLEEPPARTLLLLCSDRPQLLLPTIISRCLRLDLLPEEEGTTPGDPELAGLIDNWFAQSAAGSARAYARANLLHEFWQTRREELEAALGDPEEEGMTADEQKAMVEGEFQLVRQDTIAGLQREYWKRGQTGAGDCAPTIKTKQGCDSQLALTAITALEELQKGFSQNLDLGLSVDRANLAIESLI